MNSAMDMTMTTPTSALEQVFDEPTLAAFRAYLSNSPPPPHASHVRWRLDVLTAHGPAPSDPIAARRLKQLRARRAAFETYVEAARACGVLDTNLCGRLRSVDEDSFRAALSECLACWLFAGMLGYHVTPRPAGRPRKQLEFRVDAPTDSMIVEVMP